MFFGWSARRYITVDGFHWHGRMRSQSDRHCPSQAIARRSPHRGDDSITRSPRAGKRFSAIHQRGGGGGKPTRGCVRNFIRHVRGRSVLHRKRVSVPRPAWPTADRATPSRPNDDDNKKQLGDYFFRLLPSRTNAVIISLGLSTREHRHVSGFQPLSILVERFNPIPGHGNIVVFRFFQV